MSNNLLNLLNLCKIDQVNFIPLTECGNNNKIQVILYADQLPCNFEAIIPVKKYAIDFLTSFSMNGRNLALLLDNSEFAWTAISKYKPDANKNKIYQMLSFKEDNDRFIAQLDKEVSDFITELAVNFRDKVQYMQDFGFNADLLNSIFLGQTDQRFNTTINYFNLEEFLTLKYFTTNPIVTIRNIKLIDSKTISLDFYVDSANPSNQGYLSIEATAILNVDYEKKALSLKNITSQEATCYTYDDEDMDHYGLSLTEWSQNLANQCSTNKDLLDISEANKFIDNILTSGTTLAKLSNLVF